MSHINKTKKIRLMSHLIYGYPDKMASSLIAKSMKKGGASILEIQFPFSDPIADGPSIIDACQKSLKKPLRIADFLKFSGRVRRTNNIPVIVMSYANPILSYGIKLFIEQASQNKIDGVIIPDLPFDSKEGEIFIMECHKNKVNPILVVSPGMPKKRLAQLVGLSSGFIYCTSRRGITGANSQFDMTLEDFVTNIRKIKNIPIAVGFGVKNRNDVKRLTRFSDIVVAGSVFLKEINRNNSFKVASKKIENLVKNLSN